MRVAIAGFGVGGGAAAVALARSGHDVTIFEQAERPGPVGAGFLLQPSGQAVLRRFGLVDAVAERSWPIRSFHAAKSPTRALTTLRYDRRDPGTYALGVARGVLFGVLHEAALEAGVRVVAGTRIVDAIETSRDVTPVAADDIPLEPVDCLIAADGARSALRARIDPGATFRVAPYGALWGLGEADRPNPELLWQETRGTTVLTGLLPVGERTNAFFWGIRADRLDGLLEEGFEAFVARVTAIFPRAESVVRSIGALDRLMVARYGTCMGRRVHTDRIVAIGDAAHAGPPHLGQGANLALLDAAALSSALTDQRRPLDSFVAYRALRVWQDRRYTALGWSLAPFFQSDHRWLGPARDLALPLMTAVPPTRALMERVLVGRG